MFSKMRDVKFCAVTFAVSMAATCCVGKVPLLTLDEMIDRSRFVVEADVVTTRTDSPSAALAVLQVKDAIAGIAPSRVKIWHQPALSTSADFADADHCVFFVTEHNGRYVLVNGYAGKVCKRGDGVDFAYIQGISSSIRWNDFLATIRHRATRKMRGTIKGVTHSRVRRTP